MNNSKQIETSSSPIVYTNGHGSLKKEKSCSNDEPLNFLKSLVSLILDEERIVGSGERVKEANPSVIHFRQPEDLEKEFNLDISKGGCTNEELMHFCRKVIQFSVKTNQPFFYNQLYGGCDEYGLAGSWLTDALNTSQATYEISPVFTLLERKLMQHLGSLCGWDANHIDGIFAPGGSMANIYGIILARHLKFPQVKQEGIASCGNLVLFASSESHYSFVKGSIWMGHGAASVIKVETDEKGRMEPGDLEEKMSQAVASGKVPFMVACTAGTTVLSAFDPLEKIIPIARKYQCWVHVDAALGGTVLFSRKHRSLLQGVEDADSLTWNLHKMGGIPLQNSFFLTRHPTLLMEANGLKAEYLFQNDKFYDSSYDTGDKSIQCGRKVDSLKAFMCLFARGQDYMERLVDNAYEVTHHVIRTLEKRSDFKLVIPQFQGTNVCFWYIPKGMKNDPGTQLPPLDKLHTVCPSIKGEMMKRGNVMVNYQPLSNKGLPNFFRLVVAMVPPPTKQELNIFVDEVASIGASLFPQ